MIQFSNVKLYWYIYKEMSIHANIRKKWHNRIKVNEQFIIDNLMKKDFTMILPNPKLATDMTELRFGQHLEQLLRLYTNIDLYGIYVLLFNFSKKETSQSAIQIFQRVYQCTGNITYVLVHFDRGTSYNTSKDFKNILS